MHYTERLIKGQAEFFREKEAQATHVNVQHDDYCPMLAGGDHCCCNPDIEFNFEGKMYAIDEEGIVNGVVLN